MSKATWLKEFYPVESGKVSKEDAIQHSLKKWYGLRDESLAKHVLREPPIEVDADSCALCFHHYMNGCYGCALYEFLGRKCAGNVSEFEQYIVRKNPEPMIKALEAIAMVERICK